MPWPLLVAAALDLAALLAAGALHRAGRAPARFVGFARVMVVTGVLVGLLGLWLLGDALEHGQATPAARQDLMRSAIQGSYALIALGALIPAAMLVATAVLALVRRPAVPAARVVRDDRDDRA